MAELEDDFPPIQEDRDFPEAQGVSNAQFIFGLILLAVAVLAIYFLFFSRSATEDVTITTPNSEIVYNDNQGSRAPTPPRRVEPPVFPTPEPRVVKPSAPTPATYDPLAAQRRKEALKAEKARLEAERQRAKQRIASKQLVLDGGGAAGGILGGTVPTDRASREALATNPDALRNLSTATGQTGGNSLPSGGGAPASTFPSLGQSNAQTADGQFFDEVAGQGIPTARAFQIENLDQTLPQGTIIKAILETALNTDLPGMMRAVASENTYAFDGSNILIPKGSRLIGRYNSGVEAGQTRVFVIWERVITPSGVSIKIDSPGTDELGTAGLGGDVDTHFFKRYGTAILLSVIEGAIDYAVAEAQDGDNATIALGNAGDSVESLANQSLSRNLGIPPTIRVDQGTRINVFVSQDLSFAE